ncbi:unnamed protein product [Larinioides sclopetarius]|uniref:Uncharacterized protein n=1 Tax=Larinioides sclopetarius TaxID=280406 RepID=A0AAV2BR00_9ARAC
MNKMNSIRRLKKNSAIYRSQLAEKNTELKRKHYHNKQILRLIVELVNKLRNAGLLTEKFVIEIIKKYECLSSKTEGEKDFSKVVSTIFDNSIKLVDEVDSDNFNIYIGDKSVTSLLLPPISSLALNSEKETSNDSKSVDAFQTEFHNLSKTMNKSQKKLSDNNNAEEDRNWNLCSSPESLNFDNEIHSHHKEDEKMSILPSLHDSYINDAEHSFKVNDHSVSTNISLPLSKFNAQVYTNIQSAEETSNSNLSDPMAMLENFQSSDETNVPEGCEVERTSLSKQDFQSVTPLQEITSVEKCKSLDTFQTEIHNLSKKNNKYKKKIYKNNSENDQTSDLCSSPDSSNSAIKIHLCNKKEEEMTTLSPLHDSCVSDTKKSWKMKNNSVSNSISSPLSKINKHVFTSSQSFEATFCSDTHSTDTGLTSSMPVLLNSQICDETNISTPTFDRSQLQNILTSKQDSHSILPEIVSMEKFNNSNICDSSDLNQKIFEQDLKSSKNSTDSIVKCNNSQVQEADSDDESDFLAVEDVQSDLYAEGDKDFPQTLNVISAVLSKNLATQICKENSESVNTNISPNNPNINLNILSPLASFVPRNEVSSSNNSSTASFQNELISNFSTKQQRSKNKLCIPSFSDDAGQDRFCEFLPGSITSENYTISVNKQQIVGDISSQQQNSYANQEKKLFRMKEEPSSNNILMSISSLKSSIQEKNTKACNEQSFSVDTLSKEGTLSAVSMPFLKHLPAEELNFCTTPRIVLKNKALLEPSPKKELRKLAVNESDTSNFLRERKALKNETSSCDSANNLITLSEFEKSSYVSQDDDSLSEDKNYDSDEFSTFENLLNVLLNPLSPLPPSPSQNSKFFQDESILKSNLKESKEYLQVNQISSGSQSVEDHELLIHENQNLSNLDGYLLQDGTSISHKNYCFAIESHNNLEIETEPKIVKQCSLVHGNIVGSLASEKPDAINNVLYRKIQPCFVLLSRDDVPGYFFSLRKQSSSQMPTYHQKNCESSIPDSLKLIATPETDDLLLNENNKVAINTNNILKFNSSQLKTELKNSKPSQDFCEHKINPSPVAALLDCRQQGNSVHRITESENIPSSLHCSKSTVKVSVSNATKSSSSQNGNMQIPFVLLSKNDISNYFYCLKSKSSFQENKCNQIEFDCLNSRICNCDMSSSNEQLGKLITHDNLSATNLRTVSNSGCSENKATEIKNTLLSKQAFSVNESNIKPGYEISSEKLFDELSVNNVATPFSSPTKSSNSLKQQPSYDDINVAKDQNAYSELNNCFDTNSSEFIAAEASSLNMIKPSTSRKQNILNMSSTSKTQECYVSPPKSDVPNCFQNLRNKTPSQIVDYYNSQLTDSPPKYSSSINSFERKDNDFFLNGGCKTSAEIKFLKKINDINYEAEKISNLSAAEEFFEKELNCKFPHDFSLEEPSNLSKKKIRVPSLSFQPVLPSPNLVEGSLKTALDPLGFVKNLSLTNDRNCKEMLNEQGNISKDTFLSNKMISFAKKQETPSKVLSGNIRKCFVSLSRSDIPNYFLSLRKKSEIQTTKLNQTNFTNLISNVSNLVTLNKKEQTDSSVMNDNTSCDNFYHNIKEVRNNLFFIPADQKEESNSDLCQGILSDKSFNLMMKKTFVMPAKSEKLISHFDIIQNLKENSLKSQSLPSLKNCSPPSDDHASDRIIPLNKSLTIPISENSSTAGMCHEDFLAKAVELPINYLEENPSESYKFQKCSNPVNSTHQNTFGPFKSHNPFSRENVLSINANNSSDRTESVNRKLTAPSFQVSSDTDIFNENLTANTVELSINHVNENSIKFAVSQNCSANLKELFVNPTDQNASKLSKSQNSFFGGNHGLSLDSNDTSNKFEPVDRKLSVPPFQDSSNTNISYEDLSTDFVELPVKSQHPKYPLKRKRHVSSDCNFSERTSIKKQLSSSTLNNPLDKETRTTILLPGPFISTKWKKLSIINRPSVPNEQKGIQKEMPIPTYTTPGFQKKYFSAFKKTHSSVRDSLKKSIKPVDNQMTYVAPVRVRGRTSKSKVFFKSSNSTLIKNNIDSTCDINKLAENCLSREVTHDEKIETYINMKPQKIRKQHGKNSVHNEKTDTFPANARSKKDMNFISFVKGRDLKDESIELYSSIKSLPNSDNNNKYVPTKSECFTFKKTPLNSDIESVMKKQNCSKYSENTISNSSRSKNTSTLNENFSVMDNSGSKTIEDDQDIENESNQELIINESDNETPGTCSNSVDENFQKSSEKLLNVKSSCSDLIEDSYNFDKNSYNINFKNIIPSDTNGTNMNKLFASAKSSGYSAEILSSNKSKSLSLGEIPSKSIISEISISSPVKICTNQNNFSIIAAATSKIVATTNSHKHKTSISRPGTSKIATTSNFLCKSSAALRFSKRTAQNNKKIINKRNQKSYYTKFMGRKSCIGSKHNVFPFSAHIGEILDGMNVSVDQLAFKKCVHSLTNFLINPKNAPDTATLIFLVVHYLHLNQENTLLKYLECPESYPLLQPSEGCIVTTLLNIEKKNKSHLQGLVKSLLPAMYNLILEKKKINVYGMSSLCRVFTELCKQKGDKQKPVSLCCDLLKLKHRNSPFFIASIAGVWKELFEIPVNCSDEKRLLFSSIAYGVQKRSKKVKNTWERISKLIAEYFAVPRISNVKEVIESLKQQIVLKSLKDSFENLWYLTSSLVILSAHEPWNWTQETVLNDYIVMNLKRFSSQDFNEQAFDLFCDLYVDVYLLAPTKLVDTVLIKFVEDKVECKEKLFVKSCAAAALMKYVILAKREVPASLTVFFQNNSEHPKVKLLADMVQRRILSTCIDKFSAKDIFIYNS